MMKFYRSKIRLLDHFGPFFISNSFSFFLYYSLCYFICLLFLLFIFFFFLQSYYNIFPHFLYISLTVEVIIIVNFFYLLIPLSDFFNFISLRHNLNSCISFRLPFFLLIRTFTIFHRQLLILRPSIKIEFLLFFFSSKIFFSFYGHF